MLLERPTATRHSLPTDPSSREYKEYETITKSSVCRPLACHGKLRRCALCVVRKSVELALPLCGM